MEALCSKSRLLTGYLELLLEENLVNGERGEHLMDQEEEEVEYTCGAMGVAK